MVPILLFAVYLYHWNVQTASSDITKTAAAQSEFYLTDLENEIERMKMLQYSLLEDDNLNELVLTWETMATIARTENMNSLIKRLYTVQNSSMYIKDVSVHIAAIGRTISAGDGVREFRTERFREIRSVFGSGSQLIEWNGGLFLGAMKQRGIKGAEPLFTVEIELDEQRLQEALAQFNTYPGSGTLLLSDSAKVAVSNGTGSWLTIASPFPAGNPGASGGQSFAADGKWEPVLCRAGALAGASAVDLSFHSREGRTEAAEQVLQMGLGICRSRAGDIWRFALSTYKFIHKPMLALVKGFRRIEHGDLSIHIAHESKDEFRYLYGRFNQMVDNLRSLIDQVYKQKIMTQRAELKQLQSQINPHFYITAFYPEYDGQDGRYGTDRTVYDAARGVFRIRDEECIGFGCIGAGSSSCENVCRNSGVTVFEKDSGTLRSAAG